MTYSIDIRERALKGLVKLKKRDPKRYEIVEKKIRSICEEPYTSKPLRRPMQNMRREHVKPFVIVFSVDELSGTVVIENFDHHDKIYKD